MKQQMIPNKKGKFNKKDNEMVKLTKIILKQTANHNSVMFGVVKLCPTEMLATMASITGLQMEN